MVARYMGRCGEGEVGGSRGGQERIPGCMGGGRPGLREKGAGMMVMDGQQWVKPERACR